MERGGTELEISDSFRISTNLFMKIDPSDVPLLKVDELGIVYLTCSVTAYS